MTTTADVTTSSADVLPCNDTDDCSGHYTCDALGQRVCNEYWSGDDCTVREYDGPGLDTECPRLFASRLRCVNGHCFNETCCCDDGYDGFLCENDIDECASNPCGNDGFCVNLVASYYCVCPDGACLVELCYLIFYSL